MKRTWNVCTPGFARGSFNTHFLSAGFVHQLSNRPLKIIASYKKPPAMKQFTAVISFLFMYVFVSIICAFAIGFLLPQSGPMHIPLLGVSGDWRTWPGTILGILAGIHSAKAALNPKPKKSSEKETTQSD